jgi:hypothetical protein
MVAQWTVVHPHTMRHSIHCLGRRRVNRCWIPRGTRPTPSSYRKDWDTGKPPDITWAGKLFEPSYKICYTKVRTGTTTTKVSGLVLCQPWR